MAQRKRPGVSEKIGNLIRPHLHQWTGTNADFKRFLQVQYADLGLSDSAWRNYVSRFKMAHADEIPSFLNEQLSEDEWSEDSQQYVSDEAYYYNSETDVYVTFLRSSGGKPITVSGDTHRAMKEAYSSMVGKPASINEIGRTFQFPRAWFDEYRRTHGWTHDMDPFTNEEMASSETEDLVDELVLRNRRALHQTYEKRKWDDIRKDAQKWRDFNDTVLDKLVLSGIAGSAEPVETMTMIENGEKPYALVISPTDFHWGKFGWVDETGSTYNFEEAKHRLISKTRELISRLPYRPEKIILATGSDWFHVDNDNGSTTAGTPMGTSSCGSPAQILISGCELAKHHVDLLRQVAPVDVVFMSGNHDRYSALTLGLYLRASYEGQDDCTVHLTPHTRHYESYGKTYIGFTHGDTVKQQKLPSIMAQEKYQEWGAHRFKVWFSGHLHHQAVKEDKGAICITLPSLAANDRWHARSGYMSQAGLAGHIIDKEEGLIGSMFCPVLND